MQQLRITRKQRAASARRRDETERELPLDPRDPDITRAKQSQRRPRRRAPLSSRLDVYRLNPHSSGQPGPPPAPRTE